jgi:hypothetical protein
VIELKPPSVVRTNETTLTIPVVDLREKNVRPLNFVVNVLNKSLTPLE